MAVNLKPPSSIRAVAGIRMGAVNAGIRKSRGEDLVVFAVPEAASIAAVFTQNKARAAPVEVAIKHLDDGGARHSGSTRALVVNSGNANAGLGREGIDDCLSVCDAVARQMGIHREAVIPFSTGVIGERLPVDKISSHIGRCVETFGKDNWLAAARAIITTDTVPKAVSRTIDVDSDQITVTGIAKGSGMIEPNMATMLAFIATDARAAPDYLQTVLDEAASESFNCITVDGDTSTNDACLLVATAASGVEIGESAAPAIQKQFAEAVREVAVHLAQAIVRDGEGATKFVTINVTGGASQADCAKIAKTVANSPLVKTAIHASDPNWGRIFGAIGRAEVDGLQLDNLNISINGIKVMSSGSLDSGYCEKQAADAMRGEEILIRIDLGKDNTEVSATIWTTDLSYEYVRINAEYRT